MSRPRIKTPRRAVRVTPQDYAALLTPEQSARLRSRREQPRRRAVEEWAATAPPEWNAPPRWVSLNPAARRKWEQERAATVERWKREADTATAAQLERNRAALLDKWADERRAFLDRWKTQPAELW